MIVLSLVVLLGLKGILTGFVKEFMGLLGLVGGVFIASRMSELIGSMINIIFHFESHKTVVLMGFVVVLAAVWVLAIFLGTLLSTMASLSGLGIFDRILGFVFSGGKVFLLFSVIFYAFSSVAFLHNFLEKKGENSMMYPLLIATGSVVVKIDPAVLQPKEGNTTVSK